MLKQMEHRSRLLKTQFEQSCREADAHRAMIKEKLSKKSKTELEQIVAQWEEFSEDKAISTPVSVLVAKELLNV